MPALDTNVLVRLLVADDLEQLETARARIASEEGGGAFFVSSSVALELEWVLRSRYGLDKSTVIETFVRLLETREIDFEDEPAVERTLSAYEDGAADFADCLHWSAASTRDRLPFVTFDRKVARLPGAERLR